MTAPNRQLVARTIGDVEILLSLPADCPVPHIHLVVHSEAAGGADADGLVAAMSAFGMTDKHLQGHGDGIWCSRDALGVPAHATVHLPRADDPVSA